MEFVVEEKPDANVHKYPTEDVQVAHKFAVELHKELKDFLKGVIVFGSTARKEHTAESDIDVLIVTDDTNFTISQAVIEAYRLIVEKLIHKVSGRLHITSMTFTSFWEHARSGDPIVINILRDGIALYDFGFFVPLQKLLKQGRIRPTEESMWRYFSRAPKTLLNSRWHLLQAALDLYWAVIDSAHAALMRKGVMPPSPEHVSEMLEKEFVKKGLLPKKYATIMKNFYELQKKVTHREIRRISGEEFEKYYEQAEEFVRKMKHVVGQQRM